VDSAFFVLSKVLSPLLAPETWVFLLGAAALLLLVLKRTRPAAAMLALALALYATIAALPLGTLLLNALERSYPAEPRVSDPAGIIVLGGGEGVHRTAQTDRPMLNEAGDRLLAALILSRRFPETSVLYTSGIGQLDQSGTPGADAAATLLLAAGVPQDRLILERLSRNTAENAAFSLPLRPDADGSWILVTSAFHMRRAVASFCAAGWRDLVPWPTDYRGGDVADGIGWSFSAHAQDLEIAIREIIGLTAYRMTGRAVPSPPDGCLAKP
jgi:uncharacterized SAM-binding protein YcdF (DUF218 family)